MGSSCGQTDAFLFNADAWNSFVVGWVHGLFEAEGLTVCYTINCGNDGASVDAGGDAKTIKRLLGLVGWEFIHGGYDVIRH